jgi:hypothetical protein
MFRSFRSYAGLSNSLVITNVQDRHLRFDHEKQLVEQWDVLVVPETTRQQQDV